MGWVKFKFTSIEAKADWWRDKIKVRHGDKPPEGYRFVITLSEDIGFAPEFSDYGLESSEAGIIVDRSPIMANYDVYEKIRE